MNKIYTTLFLIGVTLMGHNSYAADCDFVNLMNIEHRDGTKEVLQIPLGLVKTSPKWSPGEVGLPLKLEDAMKLAISRVKNKYHKFDDVQLRDLKLTRIYSSCLRTKGNWFYLVHFIPKEIGAKRKRTIIVTAVLMDGTVTEPILIE